MKKITLIRHAKSDWSKPELNDFDRWLGPRGIRQLKEMWGLLKKLKPEFDQIICSPSLRTTLTFEWLAEEYKELKNMSFVFMQEIYDYAEWYTEDMIEIIENIDENINSLAIIWHNNLFNELVENFTSVVWLHIPTLTVVEIIFNIESWKNIRWNGIIKMYFKPHK